MLSISDSVLHPYFSLCLSFFRVHKKSYSGKTVSQSMKYHDSIAVSNIFSIEQQTVQPIFDNNFSSTLSSIFVEL